jgi:transposase
VGYDAGKKVKGRKIHALVNTEGLPMRVIVHSAAIQDRAGAGLVLDKIRRRFPWLELVWADGGYNAWQVDAAVAKVPLLRMEIVKRSDDVKGFVVLPRRWVVERTFSWFGRNRRLAKDFENLRETLATFVTLASIQLALRRLALQVNRFDPLIPGDPSHAAIKMLADLVRREALVLTYNDLLLLIGSLFIFALMLIPLVGRPRSFLSH